MDGRPCICDGCGGSELRVLCPYYDINYTIEYFENHNAENKREMIAIRLKYLIQIYLLQRDFVVKATGQSIVDYVSLKHPQYKSLAETILLLV